jgi:hypothetical protein
MANANHLLIGLGGTGGKIIRSLRKAVFPHFRGEQPKGANLRYLYIDSSDEMMLKDERGLDREPMRLGKDFAEAWANPNRQAEDTLAMSVTQALGAEFLDQQKREELMSKVIAEVEAIKAERKNPLDKAVRAYSEAARIADTILQRR